MLRIAQTGQCDRDNSPGFLRWMLVQRLHQGKSIPSGHCDVTYRCVRNLTPDCCQGSCADSAVTVTAPSIGKYLQLVLVGQPELALRLKSPSLRQFNQRVAARSVLNRLSFVEAHEYVGYRLRARDGRSGDIFDSEALDYLLRHSSGIPRQINVLCHNAMLLAYSSGAPLVDLKSARAAVAEHGGSLLGGAWTLTMPSKGAQPIYVGVAALALLLLGGYGYRAVPTQAPRTNADASAAIPAQTARIIGDASINVARESKAAFKATAKATVKTVAKQIVGSIPALASPPVKRAAADTSSENGSPGTPRLSSTVLTSTAEKAPHQNS